MTKVKKMFFGALCPLTEKEGKKMDKKKETTPVQFQINWEKLIPPHNCKLHSIIIMEEHDVNSFQKYCYIPKKPMQNLQ